MAANNWIVYPIKEILRFATQAMISGGAKPAHASVMTELLLSADYRGHYSHGLNRLEMYVKDVKSGTTTCDTEPEILKETAATAFVDGNNALGPVVGQFCMDLAISKAKDIGVSWVVAKGSNHFGIAGWYTMRAANAGLLGMAFTNSSPLVVPTRARKSTLGTNPMSLAAPTSSAGASNDDFVLDMATSAVSLGKVEIQLRKGEQLPPGWAVDAGGHETRDPAVMLREGGLSPLGGSEENSGYKGYGLAAMIEVFCGILGGAKWGPHIRDWKSTEKVADLGQCFVAINPEMFAPGFTNRMGDFVSCLRNLEPMAEDTSVLIPGDPERHHMEKCDELGGVPYHPNQASNLDELAGTLHLQKMERL